MPKRPRGDRRISDQIRLGSQTYISDFVCENITKQIKKDL